MDKPSCLLHFIGEIREDQVLSKLARELALDDKAPLKCIPLSGLPLSGECSVFPGVGGVQIRFHGLAEDFARNCQA